MSDELEEPLVPAALYTEHYFRTCCGDYAVWERSGGREVGGVYHFMLERAALLPGEVLVDLGTGRGELLALAVERGASRAVGVEYAEAAVALARQTLAARGITSRAEVILADARRVPLEDQTADVVTMLDVVEHLAPSELDRALSEAHRILRPGGRLHIHTFPTRTVYDVTYRLQRLSRPSRWRQWPADPRNEWERTMHVNEQSVRLLRRSMRMANFTRVEVQPGRWVYTDFVPAENGRRLYRLLDSFPPTRRFGASNLLASAVRP